MSPENGPSRHIAAPSGRYRVKADMTSWAEFNAVHYELINSLATQHRLPAIYPFRYEISNGGVASYGPKQRISSGLYG